MDKGPKNSKSNELLMQSLSKFYANKSNIQKIIPIINGESEISLRLIDWFITNYSKKNQTIITKRVNNNIVHLNVYLSYRSQLKSYSKTNFDPFRRRDRITFYFDNKNSIETTIGQLNMFRWILQSDILEYVNERKKEIEQDMIKTQKDNQEKKLNKDNIKVRVVETENGVVTKTRKKRNELSKSVLKNMNQLPGKRMIQFD
jgi:hypothetical protein